MRMLHAGGENKSDQQRTMVCLSYVCKWYYDRVNFEEGQTQSFASLSPYMQSLLTRQGHRVYLEELENAVDQLHGGQVETRSTPTTMNPDSPSAHGNLSRDSRFSVPTRGGDDGVGHSTESLSTAAFPNSACDEGCVANAGNAEVEEIYLRELADSLEFEREEVDLRSSPLLSSPGRTLPTKSPCVSTSGYGASSIGYVEASPEDIEDDLYHAYYGDEDSWTDD